VGGISSSLIKSTFVSGDNIHLLKNFENMTWSSIGYRPDTMIIHEFGHVLDNGLADSEATLFGGGPGDMLLDFVGGKSTALFRCAKGLSIPSKIDTYENKDGYGYGNNSAADYFAHAFSAAIVDPENTNAPLKARLWVSTLINLTQ